jgi:type I restriction enzyme, S subunit
VTVASLKGRTCSKWEEITLVDLASDEPHSLVDGPFGSDLKLSDIMSSGVPLVRIQHIGVGEFREGFDQFITEEKSHELRRHSAQAGDLVFAKLGDPAGRSTLLPSSVQHAVIVADCVRLRINKKKVDPNYLAWAVNSPSVLQQISGSSKGSTRQRANLADFKKVRVPVPHKREEQRRIASLLNSANELRRTYRNALEMSEGLLGAVFLEMFGDPAKNPKEWPKVALDSLCERITVGHVGPMINEYVSAGIPFLRSLNIRRNRVDLHDVKYVSQDFHKKLLKSALAPGDVVGVRTGMTGVTAVVPKKLPVSNCADLIVMTCGSQLEPRFLSEVLNILLGDVEAIAGATGAIQEHFNIGRARELHVPLPPVEVQRVFCRTAGDVQRSIDVAQEALRQAEHLFQTLLHKAFGEG